MDFSMLGNPIDLNCIVLTHYNKLVIELVPKELSDLGFDLKSRDFNHPQKVYDSDTGVSTFAILTGK